MQVDIPLDSATLWIAVLITIAGVLVGRCAERSAHFIWPVDCCSVIVYLAVSAAAAVSVMGIFPLPILLIVLFAAAYLVGFLVSGRRKHINLVVVNPKTCTIDIPFVVPYRNGNTWCLQYQSPREHFKRAVFGIHAELDTNWNLDKQWKVKPHDPLYPTPELSAILVSGYTTDDFDIIHKWRFKLKKYKPVIYVAPSQMMSSLEILYTIEGHEMDIKTNIDLSRKLMQSEHKAERRAIRSISRVVMESMTDPEPHNQLDKIAFEKTMGTVQPSEMTRKYIFGRRRADGRK
ncbi:MAG: hypothetical protein LBJ20_01695 [Candidatus Methanoplasma sp.]|jgi:hypothetical protein|nr:hypothetical protein [Candidatus Methanoplasma sp.]